MHRPPLRLNCCIACLERGVYAVETLFHVTFVCLAYADLHQARVIKDITSRFDPKAFCLHRDMWTWRQLKALRHFLSTSVIGVFASWGADATLRDITPNRVRITFGSVDLRDKTTATHPCCRYCLLVYAPFH